MISKKHMDSSGAPGRIRSGRILGIDPGSRIVGFGFLVARTERPLSPRDFRVADAGVLRAPLDLPIHARLGLLHATLFDLIGDLKPDVCVIEKAFCGANAATAIKLGEARGALLAAVSRHDVPVFEITPAEVKRIIAGGGAMRKEAVATAVEALLEFRRGDLPHDASDAVAIALTHGLNSATADRLGLTSSTFKSRPKPRSNRSEQTRSLT